jgi:hypothetical protein
MWNIYYLWNLSSSICIGTVYWLDSRGIGVRFFAGLRDFSLLYSVQFPSGAHPAYYPMTIGGTFPGRNALGAWSLPSFSAEVKNSWTHMSTSHTPSGRGAGEPVGKRPLGRPRRRGEDSIKMDSKENVWNGFIWLRIGTSGGLLWTR